MPTPKLAPEFDSFISANPLPPPATSIQEYRTRKESQGKRVQEFLKDPAFALLNNVAVENITISLPEVASYKFPLRIYRPLDSSSESLPVMLYFHGGYWCAGDANSEDFGCRAIISRGVRIIIASFEYRRIPDVPWHKVFSDAEYAMKWISTNATSIGGDLSKGFLIGGAEAGAHLAAICAIRAKNRYPNIKLTGQNLIVPTTIAWPDDKIPKEWIAAMPSHGENRHAPVFDLALYEMLVKALDIPDDEKRNGENFPMWANLEGLPPAYLPMDECDPIRDQGFLFNDLLQAAGVKTRTDYYRGLPNMFVQFPQLPTTLTAGGHLTAGIAWLLQERK